MKFIWEECDFDGSQDNWGLMASMGDEIVIIGFNKCTSLRDGHSWEYKNFAEMAESFNKHQYKPIFAPINPSVVIKEMATKKFNYGGGFK